MSTKRRRTRNVASNQDVVPTPLVDPSESVDSSRASTVGGEDSGSGRVESLSERVKVDDERSDYISDSATVDAAAIEDGVEDPIENAPFWNCGPGFEQIDIHVTAPATPHELLRRLGSSPFERGFPIMGFLEGCYIKVSRYALEFR